MRFLLSESAFAIEETYSAAIPIWISYDGWHQWRQRRSSDKRASSAPLTLTGGPFPHVAKKHVFDLLALFHHPFKLPSSLHQRQPHRRCLSIILSYVMIVILLILPNLSFWC